MASLPLTALRPLRFPSHRWLAVVCLRTGRVLALAPADSTVSHSDAETRVRAHKYG